MERRRLKKLVAPLLGQRVALHVACACGRALGTPWHVMLPLLVHLELLPEALNLRLRPCEAGAWSAGPPASRARGTRRRSRRSVSVAWASLGEIPPSVSASPSAVRSGGLAKPRHDLCLCIPANAGGNPRVESAAANCNVCPDAVARGIRSCMGAAGPAATAALGRGCSRRVHHACRHSHVASCAIARRGLAPRSASRGPHRVDSRRRTPRPRPQGCALSQ